MKILMDDKRLVIFVRIHFCLHLNGKRTVVKKKVKDFSNIK